VFLLRSISTAQKTKRFEHEWRSLQEAIPRIKIAWENGQVHFQENLARAIDNPEEMEYLSQIDFAADCYCYSSALKVSPYDRALQAWYLNGYMLAWQQHFFTDENASH